MSVVALKRLLSEQTPTSGTVVGVGAGGAVIVSTPAGSITATSLIALDVGDQVSLNGNMVVSKIKGRDTLPVFYV